MADDANPLTDFNQRIINEFRANGGVVGDPFTGATVVLLTTKGAKSGATRVNPLVALVEGETVYVFASKGGAPTNPDWYYNLIAQPEVHLEIGTESYVAVASEVTGAERDEIYERQVAVQPGFGTYRDQTTRVIPVIALRRR